MADRVFRLGSDGELYAELPVGVSAGAADAGKVVVLDASGVLSASVVPPRDLTYVHNQAVPSATWVVAHGLGKYPAVTVIDSSGSEVEGDVIYDSVNQTTLVFSAAFSGTATFN